MPQINDLLKNALILDTEVTSLTRGAGIHELAIYNLENRSVHEYIVKPKLVRVASATAQDLTKLATSPYDKHMGQSYQSWSKLITDQIFMESGIKVDSTTMKETLRWQNPFLYKAMFEEKKFPHLIGGKITESQRAARQSSLRAAGISQANLGIQTTVEDLLKNSGILDRHFSGKTIWIANAPFESGQLGAQAAAVEGEGERLALRKLFETQSNSANFLYVTGQEVNRARSLAQVSGDWTQVWKAYSKYTPKAGQTAVRDILDVNRAFYSYGQKLGLLTKSPHFFGLGMDVTSRLFGSLETDPILARKLLTTKEAHRAVEDAAITEAYVLRRAMRYTSALEMVSEGRGGELLRQAKRGEGLLAEAAAYFARLEKIAPELQRVNLIKRLERAQMDILQEGVTLQSAGIERIIAEDQLTPTGEVVRVNRSLYHKKAFGSMQQAVDYIAESGAYSTFGLDPRAEWEKIHTRLQGAPDPRKALSTYVQETTSESIAKFISGNQDQLLATQSRRLGSVLSRQTAGPFVHAAAEALSSARHPLFRMGGMAVAGLTAFGVAGTLFGMEHGDTAPPSIVAQDYQTWLSRQEGMASQGMAKERRRTLTDFGSPYQGPVTSGMVLANQEMLQAREKWLRAQYGVQHFDPEIGIFSRLGLFKQYMPRGYGFIGGGEPLLADDYTGLKGENLLKINLSDKKWKIDIKDADTISVKRGGLRGALTNFFGLNREYSFRLAGVDSTEVSHGATSYHAPQPYANEAAEALRSLVKGSKDLTLVYDPSNTTYGRMVGALIADGQNLNFEIVKRGIAAHLPYGKTEDSMISYGALKQMEERAFQANRGMWNTPWAKAFYHVSENSGNRVTFNTLTDLNRIAQNSSTMEMLTFMEQAQEAGSFSRADEAVARNLGKRFHVGQDNVGPYNPNQNTVDDGRYTMWLENQRREGLNKSQRMSRGGFGKLNSALVLDSMGTSNNIWSSSNYNLMDMYEVNNAKIRHQERRQRMAHMQRSINQSMFQSPINHHVM